MTIVMLVLPHFTSSRLPLVSCFPPASWSLKKGLELDFPGQILGEVNLWV